MGHQQQSSAREIYWVQMAAVGGRVCVLGGNTADMGMISPQRKATETQTGNGGKHRVFYRLHVLPIYVHGGVQRVFELISCFPVALGHCSKSIVNGTGLRVHRDGSRRPGSDDAKAGGIVAPTSRPNDFAYASLFNRITLFSTLHHSFHRAKGSGRGARRLFNCRRNSTCKKRSNYSTE